MCQQRRERVWVRRLQPFALACSFLWLAACSAMDSRGSRRLPVVAVPADALVIVKVRMRDQVVTVVADGPAGPGFTVATAAGAPLSGLLTAAEFDKQFPAASRRYHALLADGAGPLVDSVFPRSDAGGDAVAPVALGGDR